MVYCIIEYNIILYNIILYYTSSDQIRSYPRFVLSSFSSSLSQVFKFIPSFSQVFQVSSTCLLSFSRVRFPSPCEPPNLDRLGLILESGLRATERDTDMT